MGFVCGLPIIVLKLNEHNQSLESQHKQDGKLKNEEEVKRAQIRWMKGRLEKSLNKRLMEFQPGIRRGHGNHSATQLSNIFDIRHERSTHHQI